ncbi:MAG TPA: ABC transporter substrate-binding protein [Actinomycetales bacterium]|nr:ABC transporter substrate-binding protein [Actinomycetales bacterium]
MSIHPLRALRRPALVAAAALSALAMSACGGGDAFNSGAGSSSTSSAAAGGGSATTVVVGGPTFTEAAILEQMYLLLLQDAGLKAELKTAGNRAIYSKSLQSGEIDVVPDYLGSMLNFLYNNANPGNKKPVSTNDVQASLGKLREVGKGVGIGALDPAQASDQNAFYVSKKFAAANDNITTLSQLAALKKPVTLGADTLCDAPDQPFCVKGLKSTYGLDVTLKDSYEFGSVKLRTDVADGVVDMGESGTTDGTLEPAGMLVLKDDKKLQPAENLVPVFNLKDASDPKIAAALNKLAPVLTTEDLTALNAKVDAERQKPADVAKEYLTSKNLLG